MALTFAVNGDAIDHSTITEDAAASTIMAWIFVTDSNARMQLFSHGAFNVGANLQISIRTDTTPDTVSIQRQGSTNGVADADLSNLTSWGLDKWVFLVGTMNAGTDPELYAGDLTTLATIASSYNTQTQVISAATGSANVDVGNHTTSTTREVHGDIAWLGWWFGQFTLAQIQAQQFHPHVTNNCLMFCHYGHQGISTVTDYSGKGRTGTASGTLVQADHPPIGPPFGFDAGIPFPTAAVALSDAQKFVASHSLTESGGMVGQVYV